MKTAADVMAEGAQWLARIAGIRQAGYGALTVAQAMRKPSIAEVLMQVAKIQRDTPWTRDEWAEELESLDTSELTVDDWLRFRGV